MNSFNNIKEIRAILDDTQNRLTELIGRKVSIHLEKDKFTIAHWDILLALCEAGGVTPFAVLSETRERHVVNIRFLVIYYINKLLGDDLQQIAIFMKRDRTTMIYAIRQVKNRIDTRDEETMRIMAIVEGKLSDMSQNKTN